MPTQLIPPPTQIQQQQIYWPGPRRQGASGAMSDAGSFEFDSRGHNIMARGGTTGASLFPSAVGVLCINIGNAGAGLSSLSTDQVFGNTPLMLSSAGFPPNGVGPEQLRVTRYTFWMAAFGANQATMGDGIGALFHPDAGTATGIPGGGNPGWGIFGDGAGNWRYNNYQVGAFPANRVETVAFPVGTVTDPTAWNYFDVQYINSGPNRDASMSIVVNGVAIVTRNWVSVGVSRLVNYSEVGGGLGGTIGGPGFIVDETATGLANVGLRVANFVAYRGKFTRDGVEIVA